MERRLSLLRWAWLVPLAAVNAWLAVAWITTMAHGRPPVDWLHYVEAGERFWSGGLYSYEQQHWPQVFGYAYHYSPVLAPVFGWLGSWLPADGWRYLHFAAIPLLPSRLMAAVVLLSWPFWNDVESGNLMVFVLLAAAWALRGNRWGIGAFLVLTLLIPRPLMLPLAAWLLWRHAEWRLPFVALLGVHGLAVLATGWGPAWVGDLLQAGRDVTLSYNIGPSRLLGSAWIVISIPAAVFLFWRGRPSWAGIVLQPYLIGYYLLLPMAEIGLRRADDDPTVDRASTPATASPAPG